jgi:hypothetical protein
VRPLLNWKKTRIEVLSGARNQIDSTELASVVAERCGVKCAAKNNRWTFASAVTLALRLRGRAVKEAAGPTVPGESPS